MSGNLCNQIEHRPMLLPLPLPGNGPSRHRNGAAPHLHDWTFRDVAADTLILASSQD
ncbi:MAG: hypothetical protein WBZ37_31590 [Mycobacterium sp.]